MAFEFFFSYSRDNNNEYLHQFFEDLSEAVREKTGDNKDKRVGFFDQREIKLGAQWDPVLADGLQTSQTLVCIYSPAYFKSEFCGKEWKIFEMRRQKYVEQQKKGGNLNISLPPIIKPVIWIPFLDPLQDVVQGAQYTIGNPEAVHNMKGLQSMRRLYNKYTNEYHEFIDQLANEIVAARKYGIPSLDHLPPMSEIVPAFPTPSAPASETKGEGGGSSPVGEKGPKFVQFVFVAGAPRDFPQELRTQLEPYLQCGGRDWKPYFPLDLKPIRALAQSIAADENLYSEELPFGGQLIQEIRKAEQERSLVVLIVDSWTVCLPPYRQVLEDFDQHNFFNSSIIIPWNEGDAETLQKRVDLERVVRETFRRWARFADSTKPIYFRNSIRSNKDLQDQLRDTLTKLRADIINNEEIATSRPVDSSIGKPMISNNPIG